jgi:L-seryl-tRNA(Ser) seleniumtransferase
MHLKAMDHDKNIIFKNLPSVDALMQTETAVKGISLHGKRRISEMCRLAIADIRSALTTKIHSSSENSREHAADLIAEAENRLKKLLTDSERQRLQHVINATGVIIHTNLGRAPLSEGAKRAMLEEAARYCNLEFDLLTGERGRRGAKAESLISSLTGSEDAVIVNNCAAATLLVFSALGAGGEAIISRGELVEIGGDFRVPEIMAQSGASMKEIGTTNRTKLSDYSTAVGSATSLIVRVHPSNFRVVGFVESPQIEDLARLAKEKGIPLYEDAGSGALDDISRFGIDGEPDIRRSIKAGVDVVTFSGDKLLGGIQAGIIVGRTEFLNRIRRHPLFRTLRVDKMVYAGIQGTLESFERDRQLEEIPVLRMLAQSREELAVRINNFKSLLETTKGPQLHFDVSENASAVGGGAAPGSAPATVVLRIRHNQISAEQIVRQLRLTRTPVIARIEDNAVLIDLRTVFDDEEQELLAVLSEVLSNNNPERL